MDQLRTIDIPYAWIIRLGPLTSPARDDSYLLAKSSVGRSRDFASPSRSRLQGHSIELSMNVSLYNESRDGAVKCRTMCQLPFRKVNTVNACGGSGKLLCSCDSRELSNIVTPSVEREAHNIRWEEHPRPTSW